MLRTTSRAPELRHHGRSLGDGFLLVGIGTELLQVLDGRCDALFPLHLRVVAGRLAGSRDVAEGVADVANAHGTMHDVERLAEDAPNLLHEIVQSDAPPAGDVHDFAGELLGCARCVEVRSHGVLYEAE